MIKTVLIIIAVIFITVPLAGYWFEFWPFYYLSHWHVQACIYFGMSIIIVHKLLVKYRNIQVIRIVMGK